MAGGAANSAANAGQVAPDARQNVAPNDVNNNILHQYQRQY